MITIASYDSLDFLLLPPHLRPTAEDLAAAPVLDLWHLHGAHLVGNAIGHPLLPENPYGPPRRIVTSSVLVFAPGLKWARTVNRFYRLARPEEDAMARPPDDDARREHLRRVLEDRAETSPLYPETSWRDRVRDAKPEGMRLPGLDCGPGWEALLIKLVTDLGALIPERERHRFGVAQIKEKFGGLRFYSQSDFDEPLRGQIAGLIAAACDESLTICEICGRPGKLLTKQPLWLLTRCPDHQNTTD